MLKGSGYAAFLSTLIENGRRRCSALISFLRKRFAAETSRLALSMNSFIGPRAILATGPPRLTPAEFLRIVRDFLSARTARRAGAQLVTDHIRDFEWFQPFCNLRLRRGSEYFVR